MTALYVIIDPEHCRGRDARSVCEQALAGGAALIQLRDKRLADAAKLELARELRALCRAASVPFWLNDRADLALLCEADGLHLGQDDLSTSDARRVVGKMALGLSTHSPSQVRAARALQQLALIGFGPVFDTQSKLRPDPTVGLAGLSEACTLAGELPVVAIGGISLANAALLAATGARYAAVISAVCGADDPQRAARELSSALRA
jgi:thiamine-phosphate pyrophosphorylase